MNLFERIRSWFSPAPTPAIDKLSNNPPKNLVWHTVNASSFADPKDVAAFRKCKATGKTDTECFKVGDNGVGAFANSPCWRDDICFCALPRDVWMERWGTAKNAALRPVWVRINDRVVRGVLGDTMPWKRNISNGAGIDLNPGFAKAFGLHPPFMVRAEWAWG